MSNENAMSVELKIAGVTFEGRQVFLRKLYESKTRPDVRLVMEPTNPYDPNAVRVEFKIEEEWRHVGYVQKAASEEVTKSLSAGDIEKIECGKIEQVTSKEVIWASIVLTGKK